MGNDERASLCCIIWASERYTVPAPQIVKECSPKKKIVKEYWELRWWPLSE
jgi:hypothetical protein